MTDPRDQGSGPAAVPARQDGPGSQARVAALEAEIAALRRDNAALVAGRAALREREE